MNFRRKTHGNFDEDSSIRYCAMRYNEPPSIRNLDLQTWVKLQKPSIEHVNSARKVQDYSGFNRLVNATPIACQVRKMEETREGNVFEKTKD